LRLWKEEFLKNFESRIGPALKMEHAGMRAAEIEVFRRKWECKFFILLSSDWHILDVPKLTYFRRLLHLL